ncbi:MAG: polysaccharide biosynthesis/export family protein [Verrucomicrobia bacterium]|nr:polysaccharide biosynthesis/export family protein [Verrucomicrobiota bacterium]
MKAPRPTGSPRETDSPTRYHQRWCLRLLCLILLICGVAGTLVSGCASGKSSAPKAGPASVAPGAATYASLDLGEGDVISITCETVTNINTVAKIPLNGKLDLPFIGQVQAAGRTTLELQNDLLRLYSQQVRAEVITVKLVQSASVVYVIGAVLQPGKIPMDRPMTVLEAVMEAGGYDPSRAKISKVTVVRLEDGRQVIYQIDLGKAMEGKDPAPFYLRPFDTVQVPKRTFNW